MAFRDYKSIEAVIREFPLALEVEVFMPDQRIEVPQWLLDNFTFAQQTAAGSESEAFYVEAFIFPLLQFIWRRHPRLKVWSHRPLSSDARLTGEPDYVVSVKPTGVVERLPPPPLLAVTEAKRQDFDEGWGQCLAAMVACRELNGDRPVSVYGAVSTGINWQFALLAANRFVRHPETYSLKDAPLVAGMLDGLFAACDRQLDAMTPN